MRKHAIYLTLFATACICAVAVIGQTANYVPADRNQTANIRGAGTTIMPLSHLREYDPVTVFFDRDAVPGDPGPITPSAQLLSITPAHPGEFIRIDARTLEFRPAIPWEPLKRYRFVSGRVTRELVTLLTPPHSVSPERGSTDLEPVNSVGLEFNTKVGAQALSRLVSIEVCALPGVDGRGCRTLRPAEYRVRETVRGASDYLYRFTFNEPVGYGNRVRVSLRLTERAEFADAQWSYTFETRPEFAMERAGTFRQMFTLGTGGIAYESRQALRLDFDRELVVEFSAPPADPGLSAIRNMVTLTPAPSDFQYRIDGNRVIINLGIEQEKMYRVTLNPVPIRDRAGRSLTNRRPNSFYVFLPQAAPFARWGRGDASGVGIGIVEQFGPQHFPIRTRGISTLDFRVYRIDPLHSAFRSFPRHEPVSVRESARPPGPGEEPGGLDSTLAQANRWSRDHLLLGELEKHIMMLGSPHYSAVLDLEKEGVNRFQSVDLKPMLTAAAGGSNRPGSYLVGFRMLEGSDSRRHYVRVDVTDLCLSVVESKNRALFGVTSYSSGRPVPDARITVYGIVNDSTAVLAQGRTGQDGFFTLEHTAAVRERFRRADIRNIVVSKGDDVLTLATSGGRGLQVFADNHWYGRYGALDWLKGEEYSDERDKNLRGFVRTERPIYRPEDSVFIKGYVRETVHGNIDLPPRGLSYQVRVHAPSQKYVDYPVTLNEYGSFDLRIAPHEQATGDYRITLMADAQRQNRGSQIATTDFVVEAYRIPRFEVRMSGADRIPNDAPAEIRAAASYYAGGRVAGQEIAWKITSYPYTHRPDGFPGYILSSDGRYGAVSERRRQSVSEENGKTDETGSARLTLNPQAATAGNPVRYVVEATVTDADRQTVSARHAVVALPPFILGLKTDRHITSGNAISAEVVAIGVNDSLVAGQRVNVELKRVTWTSYLAETDFSQGRPKYITDESVELVEERVITTTDKPVPVEFKDQQPGVYIIELSSRDRLGRLQSIRVDLFLPGSGQQAQAWRRAEQNLFETIKDRTSYDPGQQARILIKSPYRRAVALAVAEKPDGGLLYQWINIVDGQGTFTLDIKKEMSPRIPVSFLLMRP
ncbi:MAG: hypothetical protein LBC70_08555, partial [Chitinispirillales bacterium]|nr:hypothetical protein [Chitinispirillales bacterium]